MLFSSETANRHLSVSSWSDFESSSVHVGTRDYVYLLHASSLIMVSKKNGMLRFWADSRKLNKMALPNQYPIHKIDSFIILCRTEYFSMWGLRLLTNRIEKKIFQEISLHLPLTRDNELSLTQFFPDKKENYISELSICRVLVLATPDSSSTKCSLPFFP